MENQEKLTSSEIEILKQLCTGKSFEEIADVLCISKRTVNYHMQSLRERSGVKSAYQIIVYFCKVEIEPKYLWPRKLDLWRNQK